MSNLLRRIGDQIHHNRIVHRNHTRLAEAQAEFETTAEPANRAVIATQIGGMLESQADHLAASWLARLTTALPRPIYLYEESAAWFRRSDKLFAEAGQR